jgi:asparagine N-glycosylation enzyme membrane subunit Stt3
MLLAVTTTAGALLGQRGWVAAAGTWVCVPLAHLVKHVLGLPDTVHPNTYASILLLAAFSLALRVSERDEEAGRLIIWQPDYFLNNNQGTVEVLDREGKVVARVGEPISLTAAGVTDWERQLREPLPEQCPGPYWVMDGIVYK